jgi:glutaredoxin
MMRRWMMFLMMALLAVACLDDRDDGTKPSNATLPSLTLTDDTADLLFTWIDDKGGTGTGVSISEVPDGSKAMVRITTKEHGHGGSFYIADLSEKSSDGTYAVQVIKRGEWEAELTKRRDGYRAKHAPPSVAPTAGKAAPKGVIQAIVYGASWCGPCHQAARFLKKRGISVIEHDIEKNPRYAKEMMRKLKRAGRGGSSIPVIDVAGTILQGFSARALDVAIQKARKGGTHL